MKHSRPGSRPKLGSLKQRIQAKQSETKEIRLQQPAPKAPPTQRKTSQQMLREMVGNLAETDDGVVVDHLPMEHVLKSSAPAPKPATKTKPPAPPEPEDLLGGIDLDKLPAIEDETNPVAVEPVSDTLEQEGIEAQEDALEIAPSAMKTPTAAAEESAQTGNRQFDAWDMDPDEFEAGIIIDNPASATPEPASITPKTPPRQPAQKPSSPPAPAKAKITQPPKPAPAPKAPAPVQPQELPQEDESPFQLTNEHTVDDDDPFTVSEPSAQASEKETPDLPFSVNDSFVGNEQASSDDTTDVISEESLADMNQTDDTPEPSDEQPQTPAPPARPASKVQRTPSKIGQRPATKSARPATASSEQRATKSTKGLEKPKEGMPVWMIYSMAGATLVMVILLIVMGAGKFFGGKEKPKEKAPAVVNEYEEFGFAKKDFIAAKSKFEKARTLLNNHKYKEALPLLEDSYSEMQSAIERANTLLNKYEATSGGSSDVDNFKTDVAEWQARALRPCWQQLELCKRRIEEMESSASGLTAEQIDKLYEKSVKLTDEAFPLFQQGAQARMSGNFTDAVEKLQQALDKFQQAVQEADTVLGANPTAKHSAHNDWKELVSTCEAQLQKARNADANP